MTVRQVIDAATEALAEAGVGSPRVDAELLAAHAAGTVRGRLALVDTTPEFVSRYDGLIAQRVERVPLQHLLGTAPFGPVEVAVGPGVFVPRPETESLLEWAVAQPLPGSPVIVDLCTGSGALALALAKNWPDARVIAVDDSDDALTYAQRNLSGTNVDLIDADVTAPDLLPELDGQVDLLVANPPYIPDGAQLEPEVAEHDPDHALFGGPDGMRVIDAIVELAARWLRVGGYCAVEHDDTTSRRTVQSFDRTSCFDHVAARRDLAGRPRFVTARRAS
ncbi:peptide chain release factor N(5)-glutamine methyltransferase [Mycobacterium deserti]|uniref:Release factor glutamine methyltransferase n=1 Tax=Mycobacterium deserti TaxID=2978347 RepID=A0ABT2M3G2_9MYCO|nr:peptide chain release factor N(5)-glutamine methyltransferase [Mycobacterium deserti]MCT7656811.1 peptide chain release factor N(5)-glutamine methyltransferase [Mycobacterium deserti]